MIHVLASVSRSLRTLRGQTIVYRDAAGDERQVAAVVKREPPDTDYFAAVIFVKEDIDFVPAEGAFAIDGQDLLRVAKVESNPVEWRLLCRLARRLP